MVLDAIAGPDSRDSTCIRMNGAGYDFTSALLSEYGEGCSSLEGMTVGIPEEFNVKELGETRIERGGTGKGLFLRCRT